MTGPWPPQPIQSGKLGKLLVSRALCYKPRGSHRLQARYHAPARARFQHLARPGARAAVPRQPGPLQLALVLGFRQRRHRQPGRPPDGHRPLADPRCRWPERDLSEDGHQPGRPVRLPRPGPDRQHADQRHGLRRHPAHLRGPRAQDRRLPRREGRQHRPPRGRHDRRRQVLPQGERQGRAAVQPGSRSRPSAGRARATSATSSPPCAAARPTT